MGKTKVTNGLNTFLFPLVLLQVKAVGTRAIGCKIVYNVSISSPSGEGGGVTDYLEGYDNPPAVSISSPSGEGGGSCICRI